MLEMIQLLPNDALNWGFCLPWLYFEALSYNLQDDLRDSGYIPPPPTNLLTKSAQLEAMVDCRDRARLAHKKMKDLKKHVARAMGQKTQPSHRSNFLSGDHDVENNPEDVDKETFDDGARFPSVNFNSNSRAEQAFMNEEYKKRKHESIPTDFKQRFVVKGNQEFPCHPMENSRCSDFPVGFQGCLGCGSNDHVFAVCKNKNTAEGRNYFHWQLHCHKPEVFFRNHDKMGNFKRKSEGKNQNFNGVGRGAGAVMPSWLAKKNDDLSRYQRAENDTAPQYVVRVATYNLNDRKLRRMPITTQNDLPHIRFPIGGTTTDGSLLNLFDTGAALNTGQLYYHLSLKNKRPDLIHSYEEFNGTNPFDPIKLCGAITDPTTYDTGKHGILSAVIRYKTPFYVKGSPCIIAYALGKDVSVNSILGIPTITELQLEYRFNPQPHIISSILERVFRIEHQEAGCTPVIEDSESAVEKHSVSDHVVSNTVSSNRTTNDNTVVALPPKPSLTNVPHPSSTHI
jgi:hypothetical protein